MWGWRSEGAVHADTRPSDRAAALRPGPDHAWQVERLRAAAVDSGGNLVMGSIFM